MDPFGYILLFIIFYWIPSHVYGFWMWVKSEEEWDRVQRQRKNLARPERHEVELDWPRDRKDY